ncbi:Fucose 4-O-acetylase [Leifsonia sp. CL147]|nr:Fucose 4-O-acetylase [Leifsonia sp. CL154]SFL67582.1 Fucose 4-O-acetylase [Leifsonia sp. CL147]
MVFAHVYTPPVVHQWVYPWHVPLFFALAGYFLTPGRPFHDQLRTRTVTLVLPYVGWLLVVSALAMAIPNPVGRLHIADLGGAFVGGSNGHEPFGAFWFIGALFVSTLLYIPVSRLAAWQQAVVALGALAAGTFWGAWLAALPLSIGQGLYCLCFVIAGRGIAAVQQRIRHRIRLRRLIGPILLGCAVILTGVLPVTPPDLKNGILGTPIVMPLLSVLFVAALILAASSIRLPRWAVPAVLAVAGTATVVVLSHSLVIWELKQYSAQPKWILLAAVLVPVAAALLLRRLKRILRASARSDTS